MHKDIAEILIPEEQLHAKIAELGEQITRDYANKNLLLLGTLKGAVPFIADLARAIELSLEIDYMAVASYGDATQSSGIVRIIKDLEGPIDQKHVLIIEDIIDSGLTLSYLVDMLRRRNPLSLRICTKNVSASRLSRLITRALAFQTGSALAMGLIMHSATAIFLILEYSNL